MIIGVGLSGRYWQSSLYGATSTFGSNLNSYIEELGPCNLGYRAEGMSVRCVQEFIFLL